MQDHTFYEVMAAYNQWMNQKLYAICEEISDEKRKQDLGAFFKSIHGTLDHILHADRAWMARFTGQTCPSKLGQIFYTDFDELRQQRDRTDREIIEWTKTLSVDWLSKDFTYTRFDGIVCTFPAWILVTHLFNHQTHHRGQLTTLLKQLGYDPGVTDLPYLPLVKQTQP
jgi:uncharacterized damage-inducible protein DinB